MKVNLRILLAGMALFILSAPVSAKITLPAFFTDNMVVQQNSVLTLKGHAKPGRTVTLTASWDKQKHTTKSLSDGSFQLEVPTPAAGGPHTITLSDGDKLVLNNILSGEVWFCSGQSNMEMPIAGWGRVNNYEQEIAEAHYSSIRLLQVKKTICHTPATDVEMNRGGWQICTPATVPDFSAVAYFYARELWKNLNVPVGVIDCTWGGTPAEAWTSAGTLKQVAEYREKLAEMEALGFDKEQLMTAYQKEMQEWKKGLMDLDAGYDKGHPAWITTRQEDAGWKSMQLPGVWEQNGLPDFDGVVWFQREFYIPSAWQGKEVKLSLGKIDDEDITYFNGQEIARGHGYSTLRQYTIPAGKVTAGKGLLTIRVMDHNGDGGINGDVDELYAEADGQRISLAGKWSYHIGMSKNDMPAEPVSPENAKYPSVLYNGMVNPLTVFPIKGVIWYQGEENASRAEQYAPLFQSLIADWRKQWKIDFPFYYVQLAGFMTPREVQPNSRWAVLREAQAEALHVTNTGMITAVDLGDPYDIHPKNKQDVGKRLASLSLANTYKIGDYHTPICVGYRIEGRTLHLDFDTTIQARNGELKGFALAGPDEIFYPAKAILTKNGKSIILKSSQVEIPVAARYNWADCPIGNLYTPAGVPVLPFRTDK